jgi:hypothetical protein
MCEMACENELMIVINYATDEKRVVLSNDPTILDEKREGKPK